jgi:tetratricopeptide (TPR) repeat protein/predicted Ser/Thr protein kinase
MDDARWARVQELFHEAAERPPAARADFLKSVGDDAQLQAQVLEMLERDEREDSLLDRNVAAIADTVLDGADSDDAPKQIGPYRLGRMLGEGGMGVVYYGERDDLGSAAAIKILRDAWMSPARRERFALEQRTLAQLNHPSIARLFDAGALPNGTPWIAMEYVDGVTLTEYCRGFSIPERLKLFRSVCEAVGYAHLRAIIHRDLKPSNILVRPDGGMRLLDFGVAKHLDAGEQTRTGLRWITPAYSSPEQIRGENSGVQTDVYSLGVILYELLTGRLPFQSSTSSAGELERLILESEPAKPISRSEWADLDLLCLTAMHKDLTHRYRSVEALIRDLDHFLNGEPLEVRPDSLRYRASKFVRRNRRPVLATACAAVLMTGVIVFFIIRLAGARNAALSQAARTQRIQQFMLNLFDGGDKSAGPAEDLRVTTLVDRGVEQARMLGSEPAVQAELYETLGGVYQRLGRLEKAEAMYEAALKNKPAGADLAKMEIALGSLRIDQARIDEGERLVRTGLARLQRSVPPGDPAILKATTALGHALEAKGDYKQGIAIMQSAVKAYDKPGVSPPEFAGALEELANHYFYAGRYQEADSINQRVLGMYRRIYGERHPKVAAILVNLGAAQQDRGNYREAEAFHRQALSINETYYGPDHPETAASLTLVARALVYEKRFDEAQGLLQRALSIRERVFGSVHPSVASTLNELGNIAVGRDQYAEAARDFQRMIDIYRAVYHDHHYLIGIAQSNLGNVYLLQKDYAHAEPLFREAIARFTATQSAEHLNVGIARIKLGRVLLGEKRYREAETESQAGLDILNKQVSPSAKWVKIAQDDLSATRSFQRSAPSAR